jgi:5-methylcytosine-specific restriction endonuclease McrA
MSSRSDATQLLLILGEISMPRPPRPCLWRDPRTGVGCPELITEGSYCTEHYRKKRREMRAEGRRLGTTGAWRKARAKALKRDAFACRRCGSRLQLEVHHVDHRGVDAPTHDVDQLETLCSSCHDHEHASTTQG